MIFGIPDPDLVSGNAEVVGSGFFSTVYRIDKDRQCCLLVSGEHDKKKISIALYSVNDAEYGWITYREVTPVEGEPYAEFAYRHDIPFNFVMPQISAPAIVFFGNVFYPQDIDREITREFVNNSFKYYSKQKIDKFSNSYFEH